MTIRRVWASNGSSAARRPVGFELDRLLSALGRQDEERPLQRVTDDRPLLCFAGETRVIAQRDVAQQPPQCRFVSGRVRGHRMPGLATADLPAGRVVAEAVGDDTRLPVSTLAQPPSGLR